MWGLLAVLTIGAALAFLGNTAFAQPIILDEVTHVQ